MEAGYDPVDPWHLRIAGDHAHHHRHGRTHFCLDSHCRKKGGVLHRQAGNIFITSMLTTGLVATGISITTLADPTGTHPHLSTHEVFRQPEMISGIFGWMMLYLATLTINLAWHGWLCMRNKRDHEKNGAWHNLLLQVVLTATSANCFIRGIELNQPMMMGIAFVGFATVATNLWFIYRKPSSPKARIKEHIKSLVGAAFLSTPPFSPLVRCACSRDCADARSLGDSTRDRTDSHHLPPARCHGASTPSTSHLMTKRAIIVGAGAGGLSAAVDLATAGWKVDVFESNAEPGGKMHQRQVGDVGIDGGPTVFTMHWVFDELFKRAGAVFDDRVRLTESRRLARHAWTDGSHLDLFHDIDQSAQAITDFSDDRNAQGYRDFVTMVSLFTTYSVITSWPHRNRHPYDSATDYCEMAA